MTPVHRGVNTVVHCLPTLDRFESIDPGGHGVPVLAAADHLGLGTWQHTAG